MLIPDPGSEFFNPGSRVKKTYMEERILAFSTQNFFYQALGNMIRDVYCRTRSRVQIFFPSRIPESKKASDPRLRIRIRNTAGCIWHFKKAKYYLIINYPGCFCLFRLLEEQSGSPSGSLSGS
jgi:hypothetical protein